VRGLRRQTSRCCYSAPCCISSRRLPQRHSVGSRSCLARDARVWVDLGGGWPEGLPATDSGALQETPVDANADLLLAVCASLSIYAERWDRLVEMQARIMAWQ
jgi:hypothetical protein